MVLLPTWTTSLLVLLAVSTGASGKEPQSIRLVKRDPSGVPATVSLQNCATKLHQKYASGTTGIFCNKGIQVGECFVNARIKNNVFATFEPDDGPMTASREGAPYGTCCAHNTMPKDEDLIEVKNANYFCFAWMGTGKQIGDGLPSSGLPGMLAWPYPLICPGGLDNCYSLKYFDPLGDGDSNVGQHKLVSSAKRYPNTTAFWLPPKRPGLHGTHRPYLWCSGRGLGCPLTTNLGFQTVNLGGMQCDPSKCNPYKGDMTILQGDDRSSYGVTRGSAVSGIKSCDPSSDPWCGGPKLSGVGNVGGSQGGDKGGSQGGSGSNTPPACDTKKDPKCSGSTTSPPPECDSAKDPNCKKTPPIKCNKKKDPTCGQTSTTPPSKCDPSVDETCTQTSPPSSSDCDPSSDPNCKQKKGKDPNSLKKNKKCSKKDGNCDQNSNTNNGSQHQSGSKKRESECGEECEKAISHKRRRNMQHMKSGWVV